MAKIKNANKHIHEGWTVENFINELEPTFDLIMNGNSWRPAFKDKETLKKWVIDQQPYYKRYIPEVFAYFKEKAGL